MVERSLTHHYWGAADGGAATCADEDIPQRQSIHVGAFNLSLILRKLLDAGTADI